jgi:hypothetical protein
MCFNFLPLDYRQFRPAGIFHVEATSSAKRKNTSRIRFVPNKTRINDFENFSWDGMGVDFGR